jgi:predicted lipoprotein with Yx(FWY)xxD motif
VFIVLQTHVCIPSTQEFLMKLTARTLSQVTVAMTLVVLGSYASVSPAQTKVADGVLVGPNGMTLYSFDKDVADSGKSMCNGAPAPPIGRP